MRLDTPFRLCSVTKQFTAVLVMQAVAAGKLRLEQTVAELWPAAPFEHAAKITVRHLLTHKSGLPDPDAAGMHQSPALRGLDHRGLLRALGTAGAALPGESFRYNNADSWLLAVLLEQATGTSYEQLLRERVFAPARMTGAGLYGAAVEPPRKPAKRRSAFPEHVPTVRTDYELPADKRVCSCGRALHEMGEEVSRELERVEMTRRHPGRSKRPAATRRRGLRPLPPSRRPVNAIRLEHWVSS